MKIASWNVNGIRAVSKKGFESWMETTAPEIVCVQEIKARPDQLDESTLHPMSYHSYWAPAKK
ncbi:MAG: exodeoxyribonuclease III, partial [Bdellovibrionales bacterium]|nr:exodeoxyribonuclease III [Bdellovibrionales bacterium]